MVNHPGGRERLLKLGVRNIPVLARGTEYVFGQSIDAVAKFVGVKPDDNVKLPPEELLRKWLVVLQAAQRYVQQYPPSSLDDQLIEGRNQSIRHMGYHVFRIGDAFLATAVDEVSDWATVSMEMPPPEMTSGADVANYGAQVMQRLNAWWEKQADKNCAAMVTTYTGTQPLRDFLERQTWHSAQHVRQLAAVLERYGVKPDVALTEQDLAGLPLPKALWG